MTCPPGMKGKCLEPGRWVIAGRHVRAVYEGRSRKIMSWTTDPMDGDSEEPPASGFLYLDDVREWIRDQDRQRETS